MTSFLMDALSVSVKNDGSFANVPIQTMKINLPFPVKKVFQALLCQFSGGQQRIHLSGASVAVRSHDFELC